jgi:hypothetical protein
MLLLVRGLLPFFERFAVQRRRSGRKLKHNASVPRLKAGKALRSSMDQIGSGLSERNFASWAYFLLANRASSSMFSVVRI